jgi:hypothetical protein
MPQMTSLFTDRGNLDLGVIGFCERAVSSQRVLTNGHVAVNPVMCTKSMTHAHVAMEPTTTVPKVCT